jgi:hypothetical protein
MLAHNLEKMDDNKEFDEDGNEIVYAKDRAELSKENVKTLIDLKFAIERQISILEETFSAAKKIQLVNTSADLDIYGLVTLYSNNIKMNGTLFLEEQTELLKHINRLLLEKCEHNWINDVIDLPFSERQICYCSNCYIYK